MNKSSIFTKISIFFIFFIIMITIFFALAITDYRHKSGPHFGMKADKIFSLLLIDTEKIDLDILKHNEIELLNEQEIIEYMKKKPNFIHPRKDRTGTMLIYESFNDRVIISSIYNNYVGLRDISKSFAPIIFFIFFISILLLIVILYAVIINSLKPLKKLQKDIEAFGDGEFCIREVQTNKNDEIAKIEKAFYSSAIRINSLIESRDIFLKNAAHELKTPIAKGFVVSHMIDNEKYKNWLIDIFSKMNKIIENIVASEEISSKHFKPKLENINIVEIIEQIRDKLFLNNLSIKTIFPNNMYTVADKMLILIAIQNLVENGIKFSDDKLVIIEQLDNSIVIKNKGESIQKEVLDKCFEPFFKETSIRNENGMGLGLYLAKKALNIQKLNISYSYEDNFNKFSIYPLEFLYI